MSKLPKDIIILPEECGYWVVMNVFARTCLAVNNNGLALLRAAESMSYSELKNQFGNNKFQVCEIEYFSNYNSLLADPTCYIRDVTKWSEKHLSLESTLELFRKHFLIIDDEILYRARFTPKNSLLDNEHFGNFHQQLGQELWLVHRESPSKWWIKQKFNDDLLSVRNNLYRSVQEYYLKKYFHQKFSSDDVIVDIGCGIGFYSNMMATTGASVLGLDPNVEYINIAKNNAINGAKFDVKQIGEVGMMDAIPSNYADYIFMSDALLFYFFPPVPNQAHQLKVLLDDISRILKPDGCFISVEPHSVFFHQPWLGEIEHPFTVITEHMHKIFGITPTISGLIQAFMKKGFVVSWMDELIPDPAFEDIDPRAYHFAKQFPLWQLYEFKHADKMKI